MSYPRPFCLCLVRLICVFCYESLVVRSPALTKEPIPTMSVDRAFRNMIRYEVETQLRPLHRAISELGVLRMLAERLSPITGFFTGESGHPAPGRRGAGRPPSSGRKSKGRGRPAGVARACAVIGCGRPSRTKVYCAAHYQKLRMLIRTKRRPAAWADFAGPNTVKDLVLPRGRAAVKALRASRKARK